MKFFKVINLTLVVALLAVGGGLSTASAQGTLVAPTNVTARDGTSPGEVVVFWGTVPDAQYYRVGWVA